MLEDAFHGRTMGALSATPQATKQEPFAPLVPGFMVVPRNDAGALEDAVATAPPPSSSSRSRASPASTRSTRSMLLAAREACDEHGALLVFDEIQCGMGRTGTLWGYEQLGGGAGRMTVAKGLGGGLPIGACVTARRTPTRSAPGDHGSTFAGGPVIAAAANAVLDVVDDDGFLAGRARGERLAAGCASSASSVRGRGLMVAFDIEDAPDGRAARCWSSAWSSTRPARPDPPAPAAHGLPDEELDEAVRRLGAGLH